jgi:ABC-type protease/lipase transport system fused ATPase/permease subunit
MTVVHGAVPVTRTEFGTSVLGSALGGAPKAFYRIRLFGAIIDVLAPTGSLFMLQIYDRMLPSGSVPKLVVLEELAPWPDLLQSHCF